MHNYKQDRVLESSPYSSHPEMSSSSSSCDNFLLEATNTKLDKMGSEIVALNAMGIALLSGKDYMAALHKFNDAFHAVVAAGEHVQELARRSSAMGRRTTSTGPSSSFAGFASPIIEHGSLVKPLPLPTLNIIQEPQSGSRYNVEDAEEWIFMATMRIMFNGALCHFFCQQMSQAENLCLLALAMAQDDSSDGNDEDEQMDEDASKPMNFDEFHVESSERSVGSGSLKSRNTESTTSDEMTSGTSKTSENSNESACRDDRQCEKKCMMILIYHLLGLVQGMSARRRRRSLTARNGTTSRDQQEYDTFMEQMFTQRMEEAVDSFEDALEAVEDVFGRNTKHLTTASIYLSMGRVFLKQGCLQGARFAFETARNIYDCPRVRTTTTTSNSNSHPQQEFLDVDSLDGTLDDEQIVALLLNDTLSVPTAPAA